MKKSILIILVFFCTTINSFSQTTLAAGEVAIIGYSSDVPDQLVFLLLKNVTAGTQIKFTDRGWNTTTSDFYSNTSIEGTLIWTATTALPIGTEIKLEDGAPFFANLGSVVEINDFNLATSGDQILVYQGLDTSPTFLNAVHLDNAEGGWGNGTSHSRTALPPGLTDGLNAIYFTEIDNATFTCPSTPVEGSASMLLAEIVTIVTPIPTGGYTGNWFTTNIPLTVPLGGNCTYIICGTTTTWDGTSWDKGVPDINTEAIINGDYDASIRGSFSACGLTVNAPFKLTISDNKYVEVQNYVRVSGELFTESKGALIQNNDEATFKVLTGGTALVNKSTSPLINWYDYTYWSSPVENETIGVGLADATASRRFWFNAANYLDIFDEIDNTDVFVPGNDDIDDNGDTWTLSSASDVMVPATGYAAMHSSPGFVSGNSYPYTFTGPYNTGVITTPITINAEPSDNDWNFIGNPYASAIDTNNFFTENASVIGAAAYLWSHNTPANANTSGNEGENFAQADYAIITSGSGNTAGGDGIIPTDFIGSGQGFFVKGIANGNVTFNNSMRMVDETSNSQFFRSSNFNNDDNRLWVNLTSDNGVFNQILVAYVNGATNGDDGMGYDATRNLSTGNSAIIYTLIDQQESKKFAIQGKTSSSLNLYEFIPVGFKTTIEVPTLYTFSIAQVEGNFLATTPIYIKDNLLNTFTDITQSDYTFTSDKGEFNNRFEIVFNNETLFVDDFSLTDISDELIITKNENGNLDIATKHQSEIANIQVFDVLGRLLYNLNFNNQTVLVSLKLKGLSNSIFIAKATLVDGKKLIKKAIITE